MYVYELFFYLFIFNLVFLLLCFCLDKCSYSNGSILVFYWIQVFIIFIPPILMFSLPPLILIEMAKKGQILNWNVLFYYKKHLLIVVCCINAKDCALLSYCFEVKYGINAIILKCKICSVLLILNGILNSIQYILTLKGRREKWSVNCVWAYTMFIKILNEIKSKVLVTFENFFFSLFLLSMLKVLTQNSIQLYTTDFTLQ